MNFEINPALIGSVFIDSSNHYKLSPPKDWQLLDSNYLSKVSSALMKQELDGQSSQGLQYQPLKIWADSTQGVFLITSLVKSSPTKSDSIISIVSSLVSKQSNGSAKSSTFIHKSTTLTQFLIQVTKPVPYVNFRLLIHNPSTSDVNSIVQIDYFIPRLNYSERTAKSIESSIGTLSFFN